MSYGRYFDELQPGMEFRHWPGRTITEFDDTLFSLMSMNQHPVHLDAHYAAAGQHGRRLVVGPLVVSVVIGLTERDVGGRSIRVLEYERVEHKGPVFHGDTIYAESTVVACEARGGDTGAVTVESRGRNQKGEIVLTLRRTFLAPRRPAQENP